MGEQGFFTVVPPKRQSFFKAIVNYVQPEAGFRYSGPFLAELRLVYQNLCKSVYNLNPLFMKKAYIVSLLFLAFLSCRKEVTELPPPTQTGANTFGLKLNGEMWVPRGFAGLPDNDKLVARLLGNVLVVTAQDLSLSPTETEFELRIFGVTGTGTYFMNSNTTYPGGPGNYGYHVKRRLNPIDEWITSAAQTGSVTITKLDTTAHIVSGTFQFNAQNLVNAAQTISVTEGRFDIRY